MVYLRTYFYTPFEIKWLKLNLLEAYDHIDKFIICEYNRYHTGRPREFIFHNYWEEFPAQYRDKIIYLKCYVQDEVVDAYNDEEAIQKINVPVFRSHFMRCLEFSDDDIIIAVDADEVIYGDAYDYILHELSTNQASDPENIVRLRLHQLFYKPTYLWNNLDFSAPVATYYRTFKDKYPCHWRNMGQITEKRVGCHFSWCMTPEEMVHKLYTYGHPRYRFCANRTLLEQAIQQKQYPFDPNRDFQICEISLNDAILPKHLANVL